METIIFMTIIVLLVWAVIILFLRNRKLKMKVKYLDNANIWRRMAYTDDLTGLSNRAAYNRDISELGAQGSKRFLAIVLFDIDNFKAINDTKGHLAGDDVLKTVANMLATVFEKYYYRVYRIGGDEFAVIAENGGEDKLINNIIELRNKLNKAGGIQLSKGYAIVRDDVIRAFKEADEMLYADKKSRKITR